MPYSNYQSKKKEGPRRVNAEIKQTFLEVFDEVGGMSGMVKWVRESSDNRKTFYGWIAKMLPKEHIVENDTPQQIRIEIKGMDE